MNNKKDQPRVDIHLIVYNGEKYIRWCLEHVKAQTYPNVRFRIFNNASTDETIKIAREIMPEAEVIDFPKNYILGGGFNRSLYYSDSPYVIGLSVDVGMASDFIEKAVEEMEKNKDMGVLQAKILRFDFEKNRKTDIIDTVGMQIFKSRRVVNIGHGDRDDGSHNKAKEIFCYEGAVPFFRREALEDVKLKKFSPLYADYSGKEDVEKYPYEYLDEDFMWYADEVDLGWRMRLLGWGSWYSPEVIAWHDRQTTHKLSGGYKEFIQQRKTVPELKRRLDLQNQMLTFIKNDFWGNILKDFPYFLKRILFLFVYVIIWERSSFSAYTKALKLTPKMLKKRQKTMNRKKVSVKDMKKWFE